MKELIVIVLVLVCTLTLISCETTANSHIEKISPTLTLEKAPLLTQIEYPFSVEDNVSTEVPITLPKTEPNSAPPPQIDNTTPPEIIQPEPNDEDFVKVKIYIPDIIVDLRYSTEDNFTKQKIYDFTDVWLRYGTVKKLILVQEELKQRGLYLKIWDGFRPISAQFRLWNAYPDSTYVANPNTGFSDHSRGNTIDVTLVDANGVELAMPTGFDDFSKLADRDYGDCNNEAANHAIFLEQIMEKYGFKPYSGEWWHFTDKQSYLVARTFEPATATLYYVDCNRYISLRTKPNTASERIAKIFAGEQVQVVAQYGNFVLVEYNGLCGYVLSKYIQAVR